MKIRWKNLTLITLSVSAIFHCAQLAANPEGGKVVLGTANFESEKNLLKVNQQTQNAIVEWQSFDVKPNERTQFKVPNQESLTVNRIEGTRPSKIEGRLDSNGRLMMINKAGMVFTKDASVDAAHIIASTIDIDDTHLHSSETASQIKFNNTGSSFSKIKNSGNLTADENGAVILLGAKVNNQGKIIARKGTAVLASGNKATLDFVGDGKINFVIDEGVPEYDAKGNKINRGVKSSGTISANGGQVIISAKTATDVIHDVVNTKDIPIATNVKENDKTIQFDERVPRDMKLAQLMKDDEQIIESNIQENLNAKKQESVSKSLDKESQIILDGVIKANADENRSGSITIIGDTRTRIKIKGHLDAHSDAPNINGGKIEIAANNVHLSPTAKLDVSSPKDGGIIHVGGEYQGKGQLQTAFNTKVEKGAELLANSTNQGHGGKVIVWADNDTKMHGKIQANAGPKGGDGGFIETSGKVTLDVEHAVINAKAHENGKSGSWLLDPTDITVDVALANSLNTALVTTDVILETNPLGADLGHISFKNTTFPNNTPITLPTGRKLEVLATRNIDLGTGNNVIKGNNATLVLTTNSNATGVGDSGSISGSGNAVAGTKTLALPRLMGLTNSVIKLNINEPTFDAGGNSIFGATNFNNLSAQNTSVSARRIINDFAQLGNISTKVNAGDIDAAFENYVLVKDIDGLNATFTPIGRLANSFAGSIDGNNKFIKNIKLTNSADNLYQGIIGLFEPFDTGINTLFDINLNNITINNPATAVTYSGSLVAFSTDARISNIWVNGQQDNGNPVNYVGNAVFMGGVAGRLDGKTVVNNITSSVAVMTNNTPDPTGGTGGLFGSVTTDVGDSFSGTNLYNSSGTITKGNSIGGIIGLAEIWSGQFDTLSNAGKITNLGSSQGGVFGKITLKGSSILSPTNPILSIADAYNGGQIDGTNSIGGLIGSINVIGAGSPTLSIASSVNLGEIHPTQFSGDGIGGLIGDANTNVNINISGSANLGKIHGTSRVGGLVGLGRNIIFNNTTNHAEITGGGLFNPNRIGGIIGQISSGSTSINNSVAYNKYTGGAGISLYGGFVGENLGSVTTNKVYTLTDNTNALGPGNYLDFGSSGSTSILNAFVGSSTKFNTPTSNGLGANFSSMTVQTYAQMTSTTPIDTSVFTRLNPNGSPALPTPINSPFKKIIVTNNSGEATASINYPGFPNTSTLPLMLNSRITGLTTAGNNDIISIVNSSVNEFVKIPTFIASTPNNASVRIAGNDSNFTLSKNTADWTFGNDIRAFEKISRASLANFATYKATELTLNQSNSDISVNMPNAFTPTLKKILIDGVGTGKTSLQNVNLKNSALTEIKVDGDINLVDNGPFRDNLLLNTSGDININKSAAATSNFGRYPRFSTALASPLNVKDFKLDSTAAIDGRDYDININGNILLGKSLTSLDKMTFKSNNIGNIVGSDLLGLKTDLNIESKNGYIKIGSASGQNVSIKSNTFGEITTNALTSTVGSILVSANNGHIIVGGDTSSATTLKMENKSVGNNITTQSLAANTTIDILSINNIQISKITKGTTTNVFATNGDVNITGTVNTTGDFHAKSNANNVSVGGTITPNGAHAKLTANKTTSSVGILGANTIAIVGGAGNNLKNSYTSTGNQTYDAGLTLNTLTGNSIFNASNAGVITFTGNISGSNFNLTVDNAANTLLPLNVTAGKQLYKGTKVTLESTAGTHTLSDNGFGGDITFVAPVESKNVGLNNHNNLVIQSKTATLNLTTAPNWTINNLDLSKTTSTITANSNVITNGFQYFKGPVNLGAGDKLFDATAGNADITFDDNITNTVALQNLTITTSNAGKILLSNIDFTQNLTVTNNNPLSDAITLRGDKINTTGFQTYNGLVTLGGPVPPTYVHALTSSGASPNGIITFNNDITGNNQNLSIFTPSESFVQNIIGVNDLLVGKITPTLVTSGVFNILGTSIIGTGNFDFSAIVRYKNNDVTFDNGVLADKNITFYNQLQSGTGGLKGVTVNSGGTVTFKDNVTATTFDLTKSTNKINIQNDIITTGFQTYGGIVNATGVQLTLDAATAPITLLKNLIGAPINTNTVQIKSTSQITMNGASDLSRLELYGPLATANLQGTYSTVNKQIYQMPINMTGDLVLKASGFALSSLLVPIISNDFAFDMTSTKDNIVYNNFSSLNTVSFKTAGKLTTNNILANDLFLSGNLFNDGNNIVVNNDLTLSGIRGSDITSVVIQGFGGQAAAQLAKVAAFSTGIFLVNKFRASEPPYQRPPFPPLSDNILTLSSILSLQGDKDNEGFTIRTNNTDDLISKDVLPNTFTVAGYANKGYFIKDILPSAGILSGKSQFMAFLDEEPTLNISASTRTQTGTEVLSTPVSQQTSNSIANPLNTQKRTLNIQNCIDTEGSSIFIDCAL